MNHILSWVGVCTLLLTGCKVKDDYTVSIKQKAVVHFYYHYDKGGDHPSLDDVQFLRLFIYDDQGRLYRDTALSQEEILSDGGALQTYLSNGSYTFVSWANAGERTTVKEADLQSQGVLQLSGTGADCLMYGSATTPVVKGDSLILDIHLFKSVFKIDVTVEGLDLVENSEHYYFGLKNRSRLSFNNEPCGDLELIRPSLTNDGRTIRGAFYTPYFRSSDDFTIGVYGDPTGETHPILCESTIRKFCENLNDDILGRDVEIRVHIKITDTVITIRVTDWDDQVIQEEYIGK